jgi:hypothetical protein
VTAIAPEPSTALEAVIGAPRLVVPGIAGWLGKSDFEQSMESGLTESFEDFCARVSREERET